MRLNKKPVRAAVATGDTAGEATTTEPEQADDNHIEVVSQSPHSSVARTLNGWQDSRHCQDDDSDSSYSAA